MLEHEVQKLKGDINESVLQNTDLHLTVVGVESHLSKVNGDVTWVLSHVLAKLVDKLVTESSFFEAKRYLQFVCVDFYRRAGCEMMTTEFKMGLLKPIFRYMAPLVCRKWKTSSHFYFVLTIYLSLAFL